MSIEPLNIFHLSVFRYLKIVSLKAKILVFVFKLSQISSKKEGFLFICCLIFKEFFFYKFNVSEISASTRIIRYSLSILIYLGDIFLANIGDFIFAKKAEI